MGLVTFEKLHLWSGFRLSVAIKGLSGPCKQPESQPDGATLPHEEGCVVNSEMLAVAGMW